MDNKKYFICVILAGIAFSLRTLSGIRTHYVKLFKYGHFYPYHEASESLLRPSKYEMANSKFRITTIPVNRTTKHILHAKRNNKILEKNNMSEFSDSMSTRHLFIDRNVQTTTILPTSNMFRSRTAGLLTKGENDNTINLSGLNPTTSSISNSSPRSQAGSTTKDYTTVPAVKVFETSVIFSSVVSSNSLSTPSEFDGPHDLKPPKKANISICCVYLGGLGNKMFQFASTFGIAAKKGMSMMLAKANILVNVFELGDVELLDDYSVCKTFRGKSEKLASGFDPKLENFNSNTNIKLSTYLQSWKYFFRSTESLRKQFLFKKDIRDKARGVIEAILQKHGIKSRADVTLVGTHIRRGDMVKSTFGYKVATKEYLSKAVNHYLSKKFTKVIFIVCSNGLKWAKSNMPSDIIVEYIANNPPHVDMAILASCDHSICTVGSFGWWASWLANGETTYYKWPAKEGSKLRRQYSKTYLDYFYPGWIGL